MHCWPRVLRRLLWLMILFHIFLITSMPVPLFLREWGNQDILDIGLGVGDINMMGFY
ncbi:hypothetical protein AH686_000383 [Salmonella enterica subsp. enterica]|nr:hypothetical protein [Salmonella enterica subsp. enterica serovar Tallahassee]